MVRLNKSINSLPLNCRAKHPLARLPRPIAAILALLLTCTLVLAAESQDQSQQNNDQKLFQGKVDSKNFLNQSIGAFGFASQRQKGSTRVLVTKVLPGSAAYNQGIAVGDRVIDETTSGGNTYLTIERKGKLYTARLSSASPQSGAPAARTHQPLPGKLLDGKAVSAPDLSSPLAILAAHDVVVIIDKSGSMNTRDCPGGMSRWNWCRDQTMNLSRQTAKCFANGITLVVFSNDFAIYERTTIDQMPNIFRDNCPGGSTNTAAALSSQLDAYFTRQLSGKARPVAIAVITDGVPNDPDSLCEAIIDATRKMHDSGEISISFVQIGNDFQGSTLLSRLDDDLVNQGATYDIVDTRSFDEVQKSGLAQALVAAINEKHSHKPATPAATSAKAIRQTAPMDRGQPSSIRQAEQSRQSIEQRLLQKYGASP